MGSFADITRLGSILPTTPFAWIVCVLFWGLFCSFVLRRASRNPRLFFLQLVLAPLCFMALLKITNDWLPHLDPRGVWENLHNPLYHGKIDRYFYSPMQQTYFRWMMVPAHRCFQLPLLATLTSVLIVVATKALEYIFRYFFQRDELSTLQKALILIFVVIPAVLIIGTSLAVVAFFIVVLPLVFIACAVAFAMVPSKPRY
ncbi:hypothetical protein ACTVH1_18790 [Gluconobacter cerinus]